jgi:hypothetical protein
LRGVQANEQAKVWKTIIYELKKRQKEKGYLSLTIHAQAIIWRKPL